MPWLASVALLLAIQGAAPSATGVTVEVRPATVVVGEPFTVLVRVRARPGAVIRFPPVPDSAGAIEAVDPRAIEDHSTSTAFDQTAIYRFIAWEPGRRDVPLGNVTQELVRGLAQFRVNAAIEVTTLLPADTAQHVPRPALGMINPPRAWWRWMLAALAALAVILMSWLAWRRRSNTRPPPDAFAEAQASFDAVDKLALVDAGEPGRAVLAYAEVMRTYLTRRFPQATDGLTTPEFVRTLAAHELPILPEEVADVLKAADAVKFAAAPADVESVRLAARAARSVVRDVQTAYEARLAAADKGKGPRGRRHRSQA